MPEPVTTPFTARSTARDVLAGVDLTGKYVVITGGASGIGLETTRALAQAGASVTVAVRNEERARAALTDAKSHTWSGPVTTALLDLSDLGSVRRFTDAWDKPLDVLVANAGIMALPELERSETGWEMQLATNFLGHFALAHGLHQPLQRAGNARVVIVSSAAHRKYPMDFNDPHFLHTPYDKWVAYGRSKTAGILLAVGLSHRWAHDGITANALMPGWITTDLQRHLDTATLQAMGAADADGNRIEQPHFKTREQGAATSALLAGSPLIEGISDRYFENNQESPVTEDGTTDGVAQHAIDPANATKLWELAQDALEDGQIPTIRDPQ